MPKVESFELDHNIVSAPYVREAGKYFIDQNNSVIKYDVRLTQPNVERLNVNSAHSIEHMLATTFREYSDKVIDISPMGCLTGFYVNVHNIDYEHFISLLEKSLLLALDLNQVPGAKKHSCGAYLYHSLDLSKNDIENFLKRKKEWRSVLL